MVRSAAGRGRPGRPGSKYRPSKTTGSVGSRAARQRRGRNESEHHRGDVDATRIIALGSVRRGTLSDKLKNHGNCGPYPKANCWKLTHDAESGALPRGVATLAEGWG